ncbi:hypothetical protein [Nitrospira sp. M1]
MSNIKIAPPSYVALRTLLHAIRHGAVVCWQHINLLGEYAFSEERLQDSVGIKPPKLIA